MFDKNQLLENLTLKINKNKTNQTYILYFSDENNLKFLTHNNGLFAKENLKVCKKIQYKMFSLENLIEVGFDNVKHVISSKKIIVYIVDAKKNIKRLILLKRAYLQNLPKIEI